MCVRPYDASKVLVSRAQVEKLSPDQTMEHAHARFIQSYYCKQGKICPPLLFSLYFCHCCQWVMNLRLAKFKTLSGRTQDKAKPLTSEGQK